MLGQRNALSNSCANRATQGCAPSADSSADTRGSTRCYPVLPSRVRTRQERSCPPESAKSQGFGDRVPIKKNDLFPNKKKLDKRWGVPVGIVRWDERRVQGDPRGRGVRPTSIFNGVPMGLRPTKNHENAGIHRCFRISSLARTFSGVISGLTQTFSGTIYGAR